MIIGRVAIMEGKHESLWLATSPQTHYAALTEDLKVDVAIIGAGFTGIACAVLLKQAGLSVAVLEAQRIAQGVSGQTTAKITSQHNLIYDDLIRNFGKQGAQIYADANQYALGQMRSWIAERNIECDLTTASAYVFAESQSDVDTLKQEAAAAQALNLPASFTTETVLPFPIAGMVRFSEQAQFHPRKYLLALAEHIHGDGSSIFENTRALDITEKDGCTVRTANARVAARDVIIATHFPIGDIGPFSARLTPMRHYAIAIAVDKPETLVDGMFISSEQPIHSIRPYKTPTESLLLVIGESHRTGEVADTEKHYRRLMDYAQSHFGAHEVRYRWSSQDLQSVDKVPYIGRFSPVSKHRYTATGYRAWGITQSQVAANILSDLVQGKENPWQQLYTPSRIKPLTSATEFVKHNVLTTKHLVADRLKKKDRLEDLAPGQGALVKISNRTVAAYKDEDGAVFTVSANCTHLGCLVSWNRGERTWDCACHGSRFKPDGQVLHAPAVKPLEKVSRD
jgi:glycine/D-amino acid oxidase-like deaminating enzyme/nitrite reductase/ring-hydroxylating ferredoxin subunit